jgi:hypothetical protein
VILSLGAVKFDPKTLSIPDDMPKLMLRLDIDAQNDLNRTTSDDTIEWWSKQPAHTQEEAFSEQGRTSLSESIDQFHKFVWNSDRIWSQGCFDIVIIEDLYRMVGRTLFDFVDGNMDRSKHHDAMQDALEQARAVQRALKKIGWRGEKL